MEFVKFIFHDGREVIVPASNIENFRSIFFEDIKELIYPDADGNFNKVEKKSIESKDVSIALKSYQKENDDLIKENEKLKKEIDSKKKVETKPLLAKKSKTKTK